MGKGKKKDKMSSSQKKAAFWEAIISQQQTMLREALVNTGMEAQTRNEEGLTSMMYAAVNGKAKSLDTLLDWYQRRKLLRQKGWINLTDDDGRTALMLAAARGHLDCIELLIEKDARVDLKDTEGKTARDLALEAKKLDAVKLMDDLLTEEVEEDDQQDGAAEGPDGLTSTQRNKLKKKKLKELERRGAKEDKLGEQNEEEASEEEGDTEPGPPPVWDEVKKIIESVEMLRAIHEISVTRTASEPELPGGIDPALWYLRSINRLQLSLAPGVLVSLSGQDLKRLKHLQTLILNKNSLESLPEEIGQLKELKVLEVAENKLKVLPSSISMLKNLELLNISTNEIQSLAVLDGLEALTTLNVSMNKLKSLDLQFESLKRLRSISFSDNQVISIPSDISYLVNLTELIGENNKIEELTVEITNLKKIKNLRLSGNPIQDQKVVKMLQQQGKALKELWKYLSKQPQKAARREGASQKDQDEAESNQGEEHDDENEDNENLGTSGVAKPSSDEMFGDDSDFDSDDSFDITMDEL